MPPVKIHCSVLAEDALKAALADYTEKNEKEEPEAMPEKNENERAA